MLGLRSSDMQEMTSLVELVLGPDSDELVRERGATLQSYSHDGSHHLHTQTSVTSHPRAAEKSAYSTTTAYALCTPHHMPCTLP